MFRVIGYFFILFVLKNRFRLMIKIYPKDTDWCDMVLWFLVRICLGVGLSPVARRAITSTNIEVMSMIIKWYKSQWNTKQTTFFFHGTQDGKCPQILIFLFKLQYYFLCSKTPLLPDPDDWIIALGAMYIKCSLYLFGSYSVFDNQTIIKLDFVFSAAWIEFHPLNLLPRGEIIVLWNSIIGIGFKR